MIPVSMSGSVFPLNFCTNVCTKCYCDISNKQSCVAKKGINPYYISFLEENSFSLMSRTEYINRFFYVKGRFGQGQHNGLKRRPTQLPIPKKSYSFEVFSTYFFSFFDYFSK